jgi:hypothetical protein
MPSIAPKQEYQLRLERGQRTLRLVLAPQDWIHRRVETVSFLPNGETRRRVSWDFTLPIDAAIPASVGQVVIPLTLLRKKRLMRLDVHDQSGNSRSVWGRPDNGLLAQDALEAGLVSVQGSAVTEVQHDALYSIVHAPHLQSAQGHIERLFAGLPATVTDDGFDQMQLLRAFAESLADNFLLVVEMPNEIVGRRSLVKLNHDGALAGRAIPGVTGRYVATVPGTDWSGARSWHLEVQAPDGLIVENLRFESWDPEGLGLLDVGSSDETGATGHIAGGPLDSEAVSEARVMLAPDPAGLVNQSLVAAFLGWLLLMVMTLSAESLAVLTANGDRAGAIAGVTLALPAIVVAWLARGAEHELVSRLLILPRLVSALTALVLLLAATALVWGQGADDLERTLFALWAAQWWVLVWAFYIRLPVGGGGYGD